MTKHTPIYTSKYYCHKPVNDTLKTIDDIITSLKIQGYETANQIHLLLLIFFLKAHFL